MTLPNIFSNHLVQSQPLATRMLSLACESSRLLPAYLLLGRAVNDKWQIAKEMAAHLNCSPLIDQKRTQSCLVDPHLARQHWCVNCRWLEEGEHPGVLKRLSGEGTSGKIAVERTRELLEELTKSSQYYRVVVVEEANQEIFHRPAANAFLKAIEETKPSILLLFFALTTSEVLSTVVSRCQLLDMTGFSSDASPIYSMASLSPSSVGQDSAQSDLAGLLKALAESRRKDKFVKSLSFAEKFQELLEGQEFDFDQIIDLAIALELKRLEKQLTFDSQLVNYAQTLLNLGETTKAQNKHYVSKRGSIESFALTWAQLQSELKH